MGNLAAGNRRRGRRHRRHRRRAARQRLSRPQRLGAAGGARDVRRLFRRTLRSRLRVAAVSVAHVRLARVGAFRRADAHRSLRRRAFDSHRTHLRRDHRTDRDRRALTRLLRLRRDRRRRGDSGALPRDGNAALRRRLPNHRRLSLRRDPVGSRSGDGRIAQVALRRTGLRVDLREAVAAAALSPRRNGLDGARAAVRVRSGADRSCRVDVPMGKRHADHSRLRSREARSRPYPHHRRRAHSRAQRSPHRRRSPRRRSNGICA